MGLFDNARKWLNQELNKNVADITQEWGEQYKNNLKLAESNSESQKQIAASVGFEYMGSVDEDFLNGLEGKFKLFPEDCVSSNAYSYYRKRTDAIDVSCFGYSFDPAYTGVDVSGTRTDWYVDVFFARQKSCRFSPFVVHDKSYRGGMYKERNIKAGGDVFIDNSTLRLKDQVSCKPHDISYVMSLLNQGVVAFLNKKQGAGCGVYVEGSDDMLLYYHVRSLDDDHSIFDYGGVPEFLHEGAELLSLICPNAPKLF
jgi:hypothetical protein